MNAGSILITTEIFFNDMEALQFEFLSHASYRTGAERVEKCTYKGVELYKVTWTRRNGDGWGNGKITYYIGKEKKAYKNFDEFMEVVKIRTSMKLA